MKLQFLEEQNILETHTLRARLKSFLGSERIYTCYDQFPEMSKLHTAMGGLANPSTAATRAPFRPLELAFGSNVMFG